MSKTCKIYYGTVITTEGSGWTSLGTRIQEPVRVEGREPFGKSPEFCCKVFEVAWHDYLLFFNSDKEQLEIRIASQHPDLIKVCFCPFCGAEIVLLEDLKLRVVKTTHTVDSYYFEKAV